MGKNFSANNLGQRKASDFYETPYSMTEQFIAVEHFDKHATVLEPACGNGAIVKVLRRNDFRQVIAYDSEVNFLTEARRFTQLITNPPFSLALEFIKKAKAQIDQKFAMLLPLSYLHGKERFDQVYTDTNFPLASVTVFTRYPLLGKPLREDGKYNTGMMVYAWFTWDRKHVGAPVIKWLDNHKFILSKADNAALGESHD